MAALAQMAWWMDPVRRSGPEAMAVDEWLLQHADCPVLRVYQWAGDWASLGYFGKLSAARAGISGVKWVRRWTGGGAVDHRADWTYSVILPQSESLSCSRGAESYRVIHEALRLALAAEGRATQLSGGESNADGTLCFQHPVGYDLMEFDGVKIAGAGQRRTKSGLLHQGSVADACDFAASRQRAERLAGALAVSTFERRFDIPSEVLRILGERYSRASWTGCR